MMRRVKMRSKYLLVLLLLTVVGCGTAGVAQRPYWVDQPLKDPTIWWGVGGASPSGDPSQDVANADARARGDLASKIAVEIRSEVQSVADVWRKEGLSGYEERFSHKIVQKAVQNLEGIEIRERWRDPKTGELFSLAILPKDVFYRQLDRIRSKTLEELNTALGALRSGDLVGALKAFSRAEGELAKSPLPLEVDWQGRKTYLDIVVRREREKALRDVRVNIVGEKRIEVPVGREVNLPLRVSVKWKGVPLTNLPVKFTFLQGAGKVTEEVFTDDRGIATAKLLRLNKGKLNRISAKPEVDGDVPSCVFEVIGKAPKVGIRIIAKGVQGTNLPVVEDKVIEKLTSLGYTVVSKAKIRSLIATDLVGEESSSELLAQAKKAGVELMIVGTVETQILGDAMGQFKIAQAMVSLRGIDVSSGEVLFSIQKPNIRGFGITDEAAGNDALVKSADEVYKLIAFRLGGER